MIYTAKYLVIGDGATVISPGAVCVNAGGILEDVGEQAEVLSRHPGEEIVDYGQATILPGLIDMHVHLGYYYSQPDAYQYDSYMVAYYGQRQAGLALRLGITTVRDLSSPPGLCRQLRLAGEKGFVQVPRMIHTDAGICMTGGHGHDDGVEEADGVEEIRKAIRRQRKNGADWIKILTSNREEFPEYRQEELNMAVDECHRRGIKTAVHAGIQPSIQMCIDAGFDTIEHGTFLTVEQAEQMAEKGIAWIPTITAYTVFYEFCREQMKGAADPSDRIAAKAIRDFAFFESAYYAYKNNFKKLYDTGVTVCAGSDMVLYNAPPFPINRELRLMTDYGVTPLEAIRTATVNPARVLGLEEVTGLLKKGLEADLLIVEGDVSRDITALDQVKGVFLRGQQVRKNFP